MQPLRLSPVSHDINYRRIWCLDCLFGHIRVPGRSGDDERSLRAYARSIPGYRQLFERVMAAEWSASECYLPNRSLLDSEDDRRFIARVTPGSPHFTHLCSDVRPRLSAG